MAVISMKQLLEAGVHFGHQTRRWNPKMKKYIFTERNGIYIIDLQKTVKLIDDAYDFMKDAAANDGVILFVGTKKQAQDAIEEEAKRAGQYYVNHRWLGGTLTNWNTIQKRIKRLKEIKAMDPGATIVMCSAMGQETMVMDSIKSGAKDFIVKPFKPERILSTVKKILG